MLDPDAVLLAEIEDFLKITGMSPSAFGQKAVKDQAFVFDMRDPVIKRSPSGRTAKRVREFIAAERKRIGKQRRPAKGDQPAAA